MHACMFAARTEGATTPPIHTKPTDTMCSVHRLRLPLLTLRPHIRV